MGLAHRRVTYKIYPNAAQAPWLDRVCGMDRLIVTEELAARNMTASARSRVEEPGRNVRQKAGRNRSILAPDRDPC